jgi:hypothetical protein
MSALPLTAQIDPRSIPDPGAYLYAPTPQKKPPSLVMT